MKRHLDNILKTLFKGILWLLSLYVLLTIAVFLFASFIAFLLMPRFTEPIEDDALIQTVKQHKEPLNNIVPILQGHGPQSLFENNQFKGGGQFKGKSIDQQALLGAISLLNTQRPWRLDIYDQCVELYLEEPVTWHLETHVKSLAYCSSPPSLFLKMKSVTQDTNTYYLSTENDPPRNTYRPIGDKWYIIHKILKE